MLERPDWCDIARDIDWTPSYVPRDEPSARPFHPPQRRPAARQAPLGDNAIDTYCAPSPVARRSPPAIPARRSALPFEKQ